MARKQSQTVTDALKLIEGGSSPYAIAKQKNIALSTIYRAIGRLPKTHPVRRAHRRMRIDAIRAAE